MKFVSSFTDILKNKCT